MCYINPTASLIKTKKLGKTSSRMGGIYMDCFIVENCSLNKTFTKLSVIRGNKCFLGRIRTRGNKWLQKF